MDTAESPERKLEIVYKYFSHHIRTNTAVVVAMLEAMNEGLSDESMTQMIMESGYLLDIFDRGMSVCFNHLFGKEESSQQEEVELAMLLKLFIENAVPKDGSCEPVIDISDDLKIICEPYSLKNLIQIFTHETVLAAKPCFRVEFRENTLAFTPNDGFYENPLIFEIFKDILNKQGIKTEYNNTSIKLRFPDESINS